MASPAMPAPGAGGPPQGGQPQGAQGQGDAQQVIAQFRALAQMVQMLAQKYPEATSLAADILPKIQQVMAKVVGNPGRVPDQKAPPNVG